MDCRATLRATLLVDGHLSELQSQQIHAILAAHIPEQIITIFNDADRFRPLLVPELQYSEPLYLPEELTARPELYLNLTMQTMPPQEAFTAVLEGFLRGKLKVAPVTGLSLSTTPPRHMLAASVLQKLNGDCVQTSLTQTSSPKNQLTLDLRIFYITVTKLHGNYFK
ncbi:hypothetical protein DL93DRAFT_1648669 [Clavulina sp. PMI_390]|nr:hypothetical protein DL93DRAFT_1648669 [Clavulina sp. PMI_390]